MLKKRRQKSKVKPFVRLIELGFLPYNVLVVQGMSVGDTKKYVERRYSIDITSDIPETWSERQQGKTLHLEGHQTVIWLKWPPKAAPWTLAHEAVHAMHMILDSAGVGTDQKNDEVVAYGVQHILRECLEVKVSTD